MPMIDELLAESVSKSSKQEKVALLLSAGVDSISVGLAAMRLGKKIHAYTFMINGRENTDVVGARNAADAFGWEHTVVDVPISNLENDFRDLVNIYNCAKKTQLECTFPFLYVYPVIKEKEVLSGIGADTGMGSNRKCALNYKDDKIGFDKYRSSQYSNNPGGVKQQVMLSRQYGITYIAPYLSKDIINWFMDKDWRFLNNPPRKKKVVTDRFPELSKIKLRGHENLQLVANIPQVFESLLVNPRINSRRRKRIMDVLNDWNDGKARII